MHDQVKCPGCGMESAQVVVSADYATDGKESERQRMEQIQCLACHARGPRRVVSSGAFHAWMAWRNLSMAVRLMAR